MEPPADSALLPLVRAALQGNEHALGDVLVRVHVHVSRYLRAWLGQSRDDVVQDLAQECVLRVAKALPGCRATTDAGFLAWCRTIAKNAGLDRLRAEKRERDAQTLIQVLNADWIRDEAAARPAVDMLLRALADALVQEDESAHEVLWHRIVQGDTWDAASSALQVSPAGSKRRYERTLRRLGQRVRCTVAALPTAEREQLEEFLRTGS